MGYESLDVSLDYENAVSLCETLGLTLFASAANVPPDLSADDDAAQKGFQVITHLIGRDMSLSGDENIAIYRDVYTPIAAHAEAKNIRLAFENWPRNGTMLAMTPEFWDAMFNAVPSPAIGLGFVTILCIFIGLESTLSTRFWISKIEFITPMQKIRSS